MSSRARPSQPDSGQILRGIAVGWRGKHRRAGRYPRPPSSPALCCSLLCHLRSACSAHSVNTFGGCCTTRRTGLRAPAIIHPSRRWSNKIRCWRPPHTQCWMGCGAPSPASNSAGGGQKSHLIGNAIQQIRIWITDASQNGYNYICVGRAQICPRVIVSKYPECLQSAVVVTLQRAQFLLLVSPSQWHDTDTETSSSLAVSGRNNNNNN